MDSPESLAVVDQILVAAVPALVALVAGLVGGYLTGRHESKLEYKKWLRSRADDLEKEARVAVAELTKNLGAACHVMAWLTWKARNKAAHLQPEDIQNYDKEMHALFPAISGSLALVSALSEVLYEKMDPLTQQVYALDAQITLAGTLWLEQQSNGVDLLGRYQEEVVNYSKNLNGMVADIFREQGKLLEMHYPS